MVGLRKTELTRQPLRSRRSRGVGVSSRLGSAPRWGLTCSLTHPPGTSAGQHCPLVASRAPGP